MKDEEDPDGFTPNMEGAKMDKHKVKASLLGDFSHALLKVAEVSQYGVEKYSRGGWLHVANGVERYTDALYRHLLGESQETHDKESKLMHSAHVAWNALAKLELELLKLEKQSYKTQYNCTDCGTRLLTKHRTHTNEECHRIQRQILLEDSLFAESSWQRFIKKKKQIVSKDVQFTICGKSKLCKKCNLVMPIEYNHKQEDCNYAKQKSIKKHKPPTSRDEPKPVATSSPNRAKTWTCHYCQSTLSLGAKHTATECDDRISWKARS